MVTHKPMVQERFLFIFLWNCTKRFHMDSEFMDAAVFVVMKQFSCVANKCLCVGLSSVLEGVISFFRSFFALTETESSCTLTTFSHAFSMASNGCMAQRKRFNFEPLSATSWSSTAVFVTHDLSVIVFETLFKILSCSALSTGVYSTRLMVFVILRTYSLAVPPTCCVIQIKSGPSLVAISTSTIWPSDLVVPSYFNVKLVAWLAASNTCWLENDFISLVRVF